MQAIAAIRVFLIEEAAVVCEGLRLLIAASPDLVVVGQARWSRDAERQLAEVQADVVLIDADVDRDGVLRAVPSIVAASRGAKALLLIASRDGALDREAALAGVHGLITKQERPDVLLKAIRAVHQGEPWFERRLLGVVLRDAIASVQRLDPNRARIASLTPREREIASLVAEGLRNEEIARYLSICEKTVRNNILEICEKLHVSGRLELLVFANAHGMGKIGGGAPPAQLR